MAAQLAAAGLRAELVAADEGLGKRIAVQKAAKVPYVLVVGDTDVAGGTIGVNARGLPVERDVPVAAFLARVAEELAATAVA